MWFKKIICKLFGHLSADKNIVSLWGCFKVHYCPRCDKEFSRVHYEPKVGDQVSIEKRKFKGALCGLRSNPN